VKNASLNVRDAKFKNTSFSTAPLLYPCANLDALGYSCGSNFALAGVTYSAAINAFNSFVTVKGTHTADTGYVMFEGCHNGISALGSILNVNGVRMKSTAANAMERGIVAKQVRGNLSLINNRIYTSRIGIEVDWFSTGKHLIDSNSIVIDPWLDAANTHIRKGIQVNDARRYAGIFVKRNSVLNLSTQPFTGIGGLGLYRADFDSNNVFIANSAWGHGFSFENSWVLQVRNNHSQTVLKFNLSSQANAYYFSKVDRSGVYNNCSDGTKRGFNMENQNLGLYFGGNSSGIHRPSDSGLSLRIGLSGYIGQHINTWNQFSVYSDTSTVIAKDESQSSGTNRFFVQTNQSDPYERQLFYPRHEPSNPNCRADQFFRCDSIVSAIPDTIDCDSTISMPQWIGTPAYEQQALALANALAMDSISFQYYNDASLHKLRRSIVKDLRDSLLVLPDTGMYVAFKDSLFGSNEDLLNQVEEYQSFDKNDTLRYVSLHSLQSQSDSLHSKLTALESGIFTDTLIQLSEEGELSLSAFDTLSILYEQIAFTDSLITIEQADINAALALRLHAADSLNNSIVPQHDFEQYEIDINNILIQTALALDTVPFDSLQRQTIEAIAAICPLEGGVAVYKARSLLYLYNDTIWFDDETLCASPSARLAEKEQAAKKDDGMKVYPNPNRGQFTLEFESAAPRTISLYNILGQRVFSARTNRQMQSIDLSAIRLSTGLLLLEAINEDNHEILKTKIIYEN